MSDAACTDWREVAKSILATKIMDPMRRDYRGVEDQNVGAIVKGDLWDILRSRSILVNATRPSWGTAMEIVYAWLFRNKIFAFTGGARVSPWLRFPCKFLFDSVEEAAVGVNRYALYTMRSIIDVCNVPPVTCALRLQGRRL